MTTVGYNGNHGISISAMALFNDFLCLLIHVDRQRNELMQYFTSNITPKYTSQPAVYIPCGTDTWTKWVPFYGRHFQRRFFFNEFFPFQFRFHFFIIIFRLQSTTIRRPLCQRFDAEQAINHYLNWCCPRFITPHGVRDDVIKWKHFPRYWPFVWGIHRSPVNSPHKGQWHGALIFTLICTDTVFIFPWLSTFRLQEGATRKPQ